MSGIEPPEGPIGQLRRVTAVTRVVRRAGGVLPFARDLLQPYGSTLCTALPGDLTRAPVAAFAAHASAGPHVVGGAFFAFCQAAYHRWGQWHAAGGAGALVDALARRLVEVGGPVRCGVRVLRIEAGPRPAVHIHAGERLPARAVVAAIDPRTA